MFIEENCRSHVGEGDDQLRRPWYAMSVIPVPFHGRVNAGHPARSHLSVTCLVKELDRSRGSVILGVLVKGETTVRAKKL